MKGYKVHRNFKWEPPNPCGSMSPWVLPFFFFWRLSEMSDLFSLEHSERTVCQAARMFLFITIISLTQIPENMFQKHTQFARWGSIKMGWVKEYRWKSSAPTSLKSLWENLSAKKKFALLITSSIIPSSRPKAKWVTWPIVIRIYHYALVLSLIGPEAGNSRNLPSKPSPLGFAVSAGIPVRFGSVFI